MLILEPEVRRSRSDEEDAAAGGDLDDLHAGGVILAVETLVIRELRRTPAPDEFSSRIGFHGAQPIKADSWFQSE
jgi:hypothetical protein